MPRIVVIGAGISGLACARGIADRMPGAELTVLEAGPRAGGPLRSERSDGFVCEVGPHGFLNSDPATVVLAHRVGLGDRLLPADESRRGRFIFAGGRLHPFPDGPGRFLRSGLLSVRGRARVLLEPLLPAPPPADDESVGALARRRLGNEFAERVVDPLVGGIYGGDMNRLSLLAAAPQIATMVRGGGSLLLGALRRGRPRPPPVETPVRIPLGDRRLVSFAGGMGELADALADSVGGALQPASPVRAITRHGPRWRVEIGGAQPREMVVDAVVCAVPAPAARTLLGPLDAQLDHALAAIRYLPAAVVALGFRAGDVAHHLRGFGYLVPSTEGGSILGVLWSSSMFPGARCPPGTVLVQAILGGARHPDVCRQPDPWLEEQVTVQLRQAIGVRAAPIFRRTFRHLPGLPQYEIGHQQRVAAIEAAESRLPGCHLIGSALRGIGINACTADADRIATTLAHRFASSPPAAAALHTV